MMKVRSIRTHLLAVVAASAVAMLSLVGFTSVGEFQRAQTDARIEATAQAQFVADVVNARLSDTIESMAETADPRVLAPPSEPRVCALQFSRDDVFPRGHLDLMAADGTVFCSSLRRAGAPPGARYRTHAWLEKLRTAHAPFVSEPFVDDLSGKEAIVVAAPILDHGKFAGAGLDVLTLDGVAGGIADLMGGAHRFSFTIVDGRTKTVLSSSIGVSSRSRGGSPVSGTWPGLDRQPRIYGSATVSAVPWVVYAGTPRSLVLSGVWGNIETSSAVGLVALLIIATLTLMVHGELVRPVRRLTAAVKQATRTVAPEHLTMEGPREIMTLVDEFNAMVVARARSEETLERRTLYDTLTGLPNRLLFSDRLRHTIARLARTPNHAAVFFIDLDRFRIINDNLGHDVGDRVLIEVGKRLAGAVRPNETLARVGGDEFVIVCEDVVTSEQTLVMAQRLARRLREPFTLGAHELSLSASIGIAIAETSACDPEELMRNADAAMTLAQSCGGDRAQLFAAELAAVGMHRLRVEADLRKAFERNELIVHYQPEIDLRSGRTVAAEALVRWRHPQRGLIGPLEFVPIAEDAGLIVQLGKFVLAEACTQAARWDAEGLVLSVSVNVSAREMERVDLSRLVAETLIRTGCPPERLCLEITESALISDSVAVAQTIDALRKLGVHVSIDDFGTGYSSLNYVRRFSVDQLKIDRAFVEGLENGGGDEVLVTAIIDLGRALGVSVVAEGVEHESQASKLRELGCDLAQGYLYAMALSPKDFVARLRGERSRAVQASGVR